MNEHLKPVFDVILPGLAKKGIDYWVYGGVSVAAYAGKFIRYNKDVDAFVRGVDFEKAKLVLKDLCNQNNFELIEHPPDKETGRPKFEIEIVNVERFALIPVYEKDDLIVFRYPKNKDELYSKQVLEKVERNIAGFRFFTPPGELIKTIFINHMKARSRKMEREEFKTDAKFILNREE